MPAFPNNVPVVKALAGCTLLAGTRRWDCAGIPEAEGISRGSPSLRPAHHHPGPSQLDPNPGKELPRQDEMIIVIIVITIITVITNVILIIIMIFDCPALIDLTPIQLPQLVSQSFSLTVLSSLLSECDRDDIGNYNHNTRQHCNLKICRYFG